MVEYNPESGTYQSAAPFNNAIDCLMRISELLSRIQKVSTEYVLYTDIPGIRLSAGQAQHIKVRLIKMLVIRAAPLLSADGRKQARESVAALEPKYITSYDRTGKHSSKREVFSEEFDALLDDIVYNIVTDLQDKGKYYMPPRDDPRRAVLKH